MWHKSLACTLSSPIPRYSIVAKHVAGRMHIRFAESRFDRHDMVALKFYQSKALFEKAKSNHTALRCSKHVYRFSLLWI